MNKGLKLANGHVLLFLNSGDLLTKNALKIIYNKFSKNKNIDFVFWDCQKALLKYINH